MGRWDYADQDANTVEISRLPQIAPRRKALYELPAASRELVVVSLTWPESACPSAVNVGARAWADHRTGTS